MNATFKLNIHLGNAAFDDNPGAEIARLLRLTAINVVNGNMDAASNIRDTNGNTIGAAVIVND